MRSSGPALALALVSGMAVAAGPPSLSEPEVKAGFLFNFANLVEWPAATPPTLTLCLLQGAALGAASEALHGKNVGPRKLAVRHEVADTDVRPCHVVFAGAPAPARLGQLIGQLGGSPVLTVGDGAGLAGQGLIASFYRDGDKVRFEINVDAARRAQLPISSRLLSLARIVHDPAAAR